MATMTKREVLEALVRTRVARLMPPVRTAYLKAVQLLLQELPVEFLIDAVKSGAFYDLVTPDLLDKAFNVLGSELQATTQRAFGWLSDDLPRTPARATVRFNALDPTVRSVMQKLDDTVVKVLKKDAREVVRVAVAEGIAAGKNPTAIARMIRGAVGLAPNQVVWVQNFRAALEGTNGKSPKGYTLRDKRFDSTINKLRKAGRTPTPGQVDKMVAAYERKLLAMHANTIARTATLNTYRSAQYLNMKEAAKVGAVDGDSTTKVWWTVGDSRVRDAHQAINGERRPIDRTFSNGRLYPDEWNCRCYIEYEVRPPRTRSR
jgi:hypothetical protein